MTSCARTLGACVMWLGLLTSLTACHVVYLRKNAPGDIDVLRPPEELGVQATQVPDDPGEKVRMMTLGLSNLVGAHVERPGELARSSYQLVIEGSLAWYDIPKSPVLRPGRRLFNPLPAEVDERFPETSFTQLNLGFSPLEVAAGEVRPGPVYMELQRTFVFEQFLEPHMTGIAAGYMYHGGLETHGPQLTVSFLGNALSLRGSYHLDRSVFFGAALTIKLPAVLWVNSQ